MCLFVFFFKQKTAYEMRISDWSSDVCSSDLLVVLDRPEDGRAEQAVALGLEGAVVDGLGLLDFAKRPRADQVRRGQRDLDRVEVERRALLVAQVQKVFNVCLRDSGYEVRDWLQREPGDAGFPPSDPQCSQLSMFMPRQPLHFPSTLTNPG